MGPSEEMIRGAFSPAFSTTEGAWAPGVLGSESLPLSPESRRLLLVTSPLPLREEPALPTAARRRRRPTVHLPRS